MLQLLQRLAVQKTVLQLNQVAALRMVLPSQVAQRAAAPLKKQPAPRTEKQRPKLPRFRNPNKEIFFEKKSPAGSGTFFYPNYPGKLKYIFKLFQITYLKRNRFIVFQTVVVHKHPAGLFFMFAIFIFLGDLTKKLTYIFDKFVGSHFDRVFPAEGSIIDGSLRYSEKQKAGK